MTPRRVALAIFALALALLPLLPVPEFWITQANYIGLYTLVVIGLLGRRLGGTLVGFVAAALCVVLPFFVVHDGIGIIEPLCATQFSSGVWGAGSL